MPVEYKIELQRFLRRYHRVIYGLLTATVLLTRFSGAVDSDSFVIYFLAGIAILFVIDELNSMFADKIKPVFFLVRSFIAVSFISFGISRFQLPSIILTSLILFSLLVLTEDIYLGNVFDEYSTIPRRVILSAIMFAGVIAASWNDLPGSWGITHFVAAAMGIFALFIEYIIILRTVKAYDDRNIKQLFENEELVKENEKLKTFQDKVEKVNSEINYQKITLTRVNEELENINRETKSLIDVMKYFSTSFDVERNVHIMLENIMDIRKTDMCGLYIDKDVYMNEEPFVDIHSVSEIGASTKSDFSKVFDLIKMRHYTEPLMLCLDGKSDYQFFSGEGFSNIVAIPAVENDNVYGVLIAASKKDGFFKNGITFYESSVIDFTSALISDRLYIKTEDMAKKDGLTQIYNRYYFNEFFPGIVDEICNTEGGRLVVAMMDIDHFKHINDTYGHLAGDEVIKAVAAIDKRYSKEYNGVAVRYGGEEFLLILRDISVDESFGILNKLQKEIRDIIINFNGQVITMDISIGIAAYPETGTNIYEILEDADKAMYFSKEHGRGLVVISGREGEAVHSVPDDIK